MVPEKRLGQKRKRLIQNSSLCSTILRLIHCIYILLLPQLITISIFLNIVILNLYTFFIITTFLLKLDSNTTYVCA